MLIILAGVRLTEADASIMLIGSPRAMGLRGPGKSDGGTGFGGPKKLVIRVGFLCLVVSRTFALCALLPW
jgi:hypothetical protein